MKSAAAQAAAGSSRPPSSELITSPSSLRPHLIHEQNTPMPTIWLAIAKHITTTASHARFPAIDCSGRTPEHDQRLINAVKATAGRTSPERRVNVPARTHRRTVPRHELEKDTPALRMHLLRRAGTRTGT
ncbi:hypothetical protein PHLGIDRAFT_122764 [Phlebiopsis gigantea 11061_1 CR5-6]|uniref:Uncharacterized protein n=1 Tax=Phlebiopsis gigantea (strain 11061_1 CR5-6) TaxID=745531 RepID=A0A0C3PB15_PHLG1|nr:hypothetical protein PHLGIDRAFT_122764 [Phlebiopsis gigantea 11061_1 CR5-6]